MCIRDSPKAVIRPASGRTPEASATFLSTVPAKSPEYIQDSSSLPFLQFSVAPRQERGDVSKRQPHVGIDFCCGYMRVAQNLLEGEHIHMAFLIHQRRRRVPQFVNGISFSRQTRRFQTVVHNLLDTPRGKALPGMLGNKKSFFVLQIRQFGALVALSLIHISSFV